MKTLTLDAVSPSNLALDIRNVVAGQEPGEAALVNLADILHFYGDIDRALTEQPGILAYYEALAVDFVSEYDRFADDFQLRWMAHARRFAKYYLAGKKRRDTGDAVTDAIIYLYSDTVDDGLATVYAEDAYRGAAMERWGDKEGYVRANAEILQGTEAFQEFRKAMWEYNHQGWTWTGVQEELHRLKKQVGMVKVIVKAITDRGFRLAEYVQIHKQHLR